MTDGKLACFWVSGRLTIRHRLLLLTVYRKADIVSYRQSIDSCLPLNPTSCKVHSIS